ncbi:hypothetical protein [Algiphilus aromaticivorans]|uniref:hypothetical protein n=1 Tax=Algiphilus aromaticivorans TaxID=382454 RepID=UPI0005C19FE3|nr:hypothetical protein [Algiphilus aromaticivorans]
MADKYLRRDTSTYNITEQEAIDESAGAADAGKIPALNADGKVDPTMIPEGVGGGGTGSLYLIPDGEEVVVDEGENLLIVDELIIDGALKLDGRLIEVGA